MEKKVSKTEVYDCITKTIGKVFYKNMYNVSSSKIKIDFKTNRGEMVFDTGMIKIVLQVCSSIKYRIISVRGSSDYFEYYTYNENENLKEFSKKLEKDLNSIIIELWRFDFMDDVYGLRDTFPKKYE